MPSRDKLTESIGISMLLDFYGELLKERPRELLELYFGEDLSLSEISAMTGITRQGVRDAIRKGEVFLRETEEKLGLVKRFGETSKTVETIVEGLEVLASQTLTTEKAGEEAARLAELARSLL